MLILRFKLENVEECVENDEALRRTWKWETKKSTAAPPGPDDNYTPVHQVTQRTNLQ